MSDLAETVQAQLSRSLVRIQDLDGRNLGTGVALGADGSVLTCAHVCAGLQAVVLTLPSQAISRTLPADRILVADRGDVAFISGVFPELLAPCPIAETGPTPAGLRWAGFAFEDSGIVGQTHGLGKLIGETRIQYAFQGRAYVHDVWQVSDGPVAPGMSGAPVVDPDSGSLVGLVVCDFLDGQAGERRQLEQMVGYVLPLREIDQGQISNLLKRARDETPRLGPLPNELGARIMARGISGRKLSELLETDQFNPALFVRREAATQVFNSFIGSGKTLLPVVDLSGSGKSTFFASLLHEHTCPILLIRGADIASRTDSLEGLCDRELADYGIPAWVRPTRLADWAATFGAWDRPVILIDGINEADLPSRQMRDDWLPGAVALGRRLGIKLAVSSRPELWGELRARVSDDDVFAPQQHAMPPADINQARPAALERPTQSYALGDFTPDERESYLALLEQTDLMDIEGLGHPLTLALAVKAAQRPGAAPTGRIGLFELLQMYLDQALDEIALRQRNPSARQRMMRSLDTIARHLLRSGSDVLHPDEIDDAHLDAIGELERENILLRGPTGLRFRYDLVSEDRQGRIIDRAAVLASETQTDPASGVRVSAEIIAAACRRGAFSDQEFQDLLAYCDKADPLSSIEVLSQCNTADDHKFKQILNRVRDFLISNRYLESYVARLALSGRWSYRLKIAVLEEIGLSQDGYDYRQKTVHDSVYHTSLENSIKYSNIAPLVRSLYLENPNDVLKRFGLWLNRSEKLVGDDGRGSGEGSFGSWALCLLFSLRNYFGISRTLACVNDSGNYSFFVSFCEGSIITDGPEVLRWAENHLDEANPNLEQLIRVFSMLKKAPGVGDVPETLLKRCLTMATKPWQLVDLADSLAGAPETRELAWQALASLEELGQTSTWTLRRLAVLDFERAYVVADRWLTQAKAKNAPAEVLDELVMVLSDVADGDNAIKQGMLDQEARDRWSRRVAFALQCHAEGARTYKTATALEALAYAADQRVGVASGLLEAIGQMVRADSEDALSSLRYLLSEHHGDLGFVRSICVTVFQNIDTLNFGRSIIDGLKPSIWQNREPSSFVLELCQKGAAILEERFGFAGN